MVAQALASGSGGQLSGVADWPVVAASLSMVVAAALLSRWMGLRVEGSLMWASVRAAVQLMAVGFLLAVILRSTTPGLWAWLWVAGMVAISSVVMIRRAPKGPRVSVAAFGATAVAAGTGLGVTFGFGVVPYDPISVVVVAGIVLGNSMPQGVLAVRQTVSQTRGQPGVVEALLSLGFDRRGVVGFLAPEAARMALVPQIERTKVVGLIALPGAMTGLLLAGVHPVDAVILQLLVMYLVLGAAAITVVTMVLAVARSAVTPELHLAGWVKAGGGEPTPGGRPRRSGGSPR